MGIKTKIVLAAAAACMIAGPMAIFAEETTTPTTQTTLPSPQSVKNGWNELSDGSWCYYDSGEFVKNDWEKVGNYWYLFDEDGIMQTGLATDPNGDQYVLADSGEMLGGWQEVEDTWYHADTSSGIVDTSKWIKSGSTWYYVEKDGKMVAGQSDEIAGETYFFDESGAMLTGWVKAEGNYYYCNASGEMVTSSWVKSSGKWYYMDKDGVMQTGWINDTYYCDESGAMVTGWSHADSEDDAWYYFNGSGEKTTGWQKVSGKWYYMDEDGVMQTDWQTIDGKEYYLNESGAMVTGWQYLNKQMTAHTGGAGWFYFNASGELQTSKWIGGKYYVANNGIMVTNVYVHDGSWYYWVGSDGAYVSKWDTQTEPTDGDIFETK